MNEMMNYEENRPAFDMRTGYRGVVSLDNVRITHKNFKGIGTPFNHDGDRNFSIVIPTKEAADALVADGWNVKVKPPREEGDEPFIFLPVKVKFSQYGPNIYKTSGNNTIKLSEETVGILDDADIVNARIDIRPYVWNVSGNTGKTAYLQAMQVFQLLDRFAAEFEAEKIAKATVGIDAYGNPHSLIDGRDVEWSDVE